MSKVKKVIALVLVVALCVSLLSSLAFAEGSDFKPETTSDPTKTPYKVLFFSDQSLLGKNMVGEANADDYQSYANEFVQYVQDRVGNNYAVEGIFANKGYTGMRNSDLYAAIKPDDSVVLSKVLGSNPKPTDDAYYKDLFGKSFDAKALGKQLLGLDENGKADPDVKAIVLDLTHNDLSLYLLARLKDIVADYAKYVNDATRNEKPYEYMGTYKDDSASLLPGQFTQDESWLLNVALAGLGKALDNLLYTDIGGAVRAAVTYTMENFCIGFTEAALVLKYWYPGAKLIVVGATNELDGVKVTLPKAAEPAATQDVEPEPAEPETTKIDLGYIYGVMADLANLYITSFSDKYAINSTYYYADVADSIEPIYKELGTLETSDAVRSEFVSKVNEEFTDLAMKYLVDKTLEDIGDDSGNKEKTLADYIKDVEKTVAKAFIKELVGDSNLADNVIAATKSSDKFDLSVITEDNFATIVGNAIFNGMTKTPGDFVNGSPSDIAILGLYGLVAGNGYALYPTEDSQYSKLQAVEEAFVSLRPANYDSGSSIGNVVIDGIVGVLTVFSSDILQALSSIFNPDTGIFARIFGGISGFFENLFNGGLFNRVDTETT